MVKRKHHAMKIDKLQLAQHFLINFLKHTLTEVKIKNFNEIDFFAKNVKLGQSLQNL